MCAQNRSNACSLSVPRASRRRVVLLQSSPSVQLLPHGSFSASNTAACWNSANCPAVFQSRSHVSGNKQDQLHETLDVPHDGQVCRGADHSIINSCVSTEGHQDVSHLVDLGTARSVSRNQATPAVQTCTNLANSSYAHPWENSAKNSAPLHICPRLSARAPKASVICDTPTAALFNAWLSTTPKQVLLQSSPMETAVLLQSTLKNHSWPR